MRRPSPVKHHHEIQLNPGQQEKLSSQDGSNSLQQVQLQTIQVEKILKMMGGHIFGHWDNPRELTSDQISENV